MTGCEDIDVLAAVRQLLATGQQNSSMLRNVRALSQTDGTNDFDEYTPDYCEGYDNAVKQFASLVRRLPESETADAAALLTAVSNMQEAATERDDLHHALIEITTAIGAEIEESADPDAVVHAVQQYAIDRDVAVRQLDRVVAECQERAQRQAATISAMRQAQFPESFTQVADMLAQLKMDTPTDQKITDDFVTMLRAAAQKATSILGQDVGQVVPGGESARDQPVPTGEVAGHE